MVEELLLGDNPFIGVSHLAQSKAFEEASEASLEKKIEVIEAAVEAGATGFTFSTHPSNLELLSHIAAEKPRLLEKLNYYILVPYAYGYVRKASSLGIIGLLKEAFSRLLGGKASSLKSMISLNPYRLAAQFLLSELNPYLRILPRENIKAILLHEVATELIAAFDAPEFLASLIDWSASVIEIPLGIETRNIGILEKWLYENKVKVDYIMTPLNPLGYQMAPSKLEAEESIKRLARGSKIIAINILASGAVPLARALEYLKSYCKYIQAVAVGTSKSWRARENFTALSRLRDQC